jgi:hypothetical protein
MNPEELARKNIDGQLAQAGWCVQDRAQMNLYAGSGVAVCEFPVERRLEAVREVESAVEVGLKRPGRLRQAVLRFAFEGRLR